MERSSCCECGVDPFTFPAGFRIVDAPIHTLCIETHRVRDSQRHKLSVDEWKQAFRQVAGSDRYIFTETQQVEAIHKIVIGFVRASVLHCTLIIRTRIWIKRPAFRTMLASSGLWTIERSFAFAAIESRKLAAGERCPDHAVAVHIHAARSESLGRSFRIEIGRAHV